MIKYYRIIPISSYNRSMYDTIADVALAIDKPYKKLLETVGLDYKGDAVDKIVNPPVNYFSIENLIMRRLNSYCESNELNIRISRPIIRRQVNEIPNNSKNSGRNSLGWR